MASESVKFVIGEVYGFTLIQMQTTHIMCVICLGTDRTNTAQEITIIQWLHVRGSRQWSTELQANGLAERARGVGTALAASYQGSRPWPSCMVLDV